MIGANFPEGIHHVSGTVKTEDILLGPVDCEFASCLNVGVLGEIECPEAGLRQVLEEDIPPFAKVGVPVHGVLLC